MDKKILISLFLVSLMIVPFIVKEGSYNGIFSENSTIRKTLNPNAVGDPIGDSGILAQETTTEFTIDGNLSDWKSEGIESETFDNVEVYLAFDTNYVYVGLEWFDITFSDKFGIWNKTGPESTYDTNWDYSRGADDLAAIGFSPSDNLSKGDIWVWTASNRTQNYAFDCDVDFNPDSGSTPFLFNCNESYAHYYRSKPLYDNDWNPIIDYESIPNFTLIDGWYNKSSIVSTDSQDDVAMNWTYTNEHYVVEFKRELDTTNSDDYALDFTGEELTFWLKVRNEDDTYRNYYYLDYNYQISLANEQAELTFDTIPSTISEALLITGDIYDDFEELDIRIASSGWEDTWGPDAYDYPTINTATGEWSYLFFYSEFEMPLGTNNITVTFYPMYEDPIILWQEIDFEDTRPPDIYGITDVSEQYPNGIPLDVDKVYVTIGVDDNYFPTDDLVVNLYYYKDDFVALKVDMTQFAPGSRTFTCQLEIEHDENIVYLYNYFVQIYDAELNKATSDHYNFTSVAGVYTEQQTGTENSHIVPLPTMEIVLGALILTAVIREFASKKRK